MVIRGRRDAQKWHSPDPAGVRDQGFTRRIACAGATQAGKSVKGTNYLVKVIKEAYTSTNYPNKTMRKNSDSYAEGRSAPCARSMSCGLVGIISLMASFGATMKKAC